MGKVKVIALLALAFTALANSAFAAEESRQWDKWNVAPYASSQEEACKKAPVAIDGFTMPAPVKEHFKKLLGATCKGGTEAWLAPGTSLEQMWSGKSGKKPPHLLNKVAVGELPVLKSPDGRSYRKGAVAETAKALAWRVEHEGRAYTLYLPFVCFNWAWKFGVPPLPQTPPAPAPVLITPPSPPPLVCATVEYTVEPGDEVRFAVLAQKRLPASACWQLCDGADCAAPPSPCDTCDWIGPKSVIPDGFEPLHTGRYVAMNAKQSLRFPLEARADYVALCVTHDGFGESNSWIVQPSAWGRATTVVVPYGGFTWPVWGEETIWPGWEQYPPVN